MKGYGVTDLETQQRVDENTLFMVASNTKLFTGTALAQLEYHHRLSLDDLIIKYIPSFQLYSDLLTSQVTIRDMLGHHLGTKTFQGDFTFWNSNLARRQIIEKMKYLKPSGLFRQSYGYCNSCFLTAGEIIPLVTNIPWEVYVYDSIFMPAGMNRTYALGYNTEEMKNVATPYSNTFSKTLTRLPYDNIDNIAPAGSMVSCVKDMAKWLLLQLDSGRVAGKIVLPWQVLQRTRDMQTIVSSRKSARSPSHFIGYGLGVFVTDYAGRQVYWHTGGADGFVTNTCFVPEENLGITILTNNDNQQFFEILRLQLLDAYLGQPWQDRSKQALTSFKAEMQEHYSNLEAQQFRVKGNKPILPFSTYQGVYKNELYGQIKIVVAGKVLQINFDGHAGLKGYLQYMDNDEWLLHFSNPSYGVSVTRFKTYNGKIEGVTIKVNDFIEFDPYYFEKMN
jgi:CubicO group peptidase (beta-lactamase class C family)